jgi:hypothetical protein
VAGKSIVKSIIKKLIRVVVFLWYF